MAFDVPRDTIFPVASVDVRLDDGRHPFERENEAAVAENWQRELAEKPALFNGTVMLLSELRYDGRDLAGRCHAVSYATFLYWRRIRPTGGAGHSFAHAALVTGEGALIAVRMGGHTANAGRVYFAAGSFEPVDFRDGRVDLDFNMVREVREETGLDISGLPHDAGYQAHASDAGTVICRRYRLADDAETIARRIREHVATDPEPEIDGPVIIRDAADLPDGLMPHMRPLIEWHFANPR